MSEQVFVALLALVGTLLGSGAGILVSNRLVNFRLEQLEKKVDKHNRLVERMAVAEWEISALARRVGEPGKEKQNGAK